MVLSLSRTGINRIGTEMYISDTTDWGTSTTPRGSVSLFFDAIYITSKGEFKIDILPYNPEAVDNIVLQTPQDGYIKIFMIAVPTSEPTVNDELGTKDGQIVKFNNGTLEVVTIQELVANPLFLNVTEFKTLLLARIIIYRNRKNLKLVMLKMTRHDERDYNREISDIQTQHDLARGLLEGAMYLWCMDNFVQAQEIVEAFNSIIQEDATV